jgi:hypothetical protein
MKLTNLDIQSKIDDRSLPFIIIDYNVMGKVYFPSKKSMG